jgi:hypothetical protein
LPNRSAAPRIAAFHDVDRFSCAMGRFRRRRLKELTVRTRIGTCVLALLGISASMLIAGTGQTNTQKPPVINAGQQILSVTGNYSGGINGGLLSGTSSGTIDVSGLGVNDMTIDFTAVPPGYHPFAVACRKISHLGGNGAKDSLGTMNLFELTGGTYTAQTIYTWPSLPGDTIRSTATVTTTGSNMTYDVSYNGTYHGFTDLVALSNYHLQYTMAGQGVMAEDASGTVRRAGGGTFVVNTRTIYSGVETPLPFSSETGTFKINAYTFNGSHYHFNWNVTLQPGAFVPALPSWGFAVVGVLLGLIGAVALMRPRRGTVRA